MNIRKFLKLSTLSIFLLGNINFMKAGIFSRDNEYSFVLKEKNPNVFCGYTLLNKIAKSFANADCRAVIDYRSGYYSGGWRTLIKGYDSYSRDGDTLMNNFESCSTSRQANLTVHYAMNSLIKRGVCNANSINSISIRPTDAKK